MRRLFIALLCLLPWSLTAQAEDQAPRVALETSQGTILITLFPEQAPHSVASFLAYVDDGFYDGTVFHRVIRNFMIQGGGFGDDYSRKSTREPVRNEADNGLSNRRGTLALARTNDPHSATSQFFINTVNNSRLDHTGRTPTGWGYAVFGEVVEGMGVVDSISAVTTGRGLIGGMPAGDVPRDPVIIKRAYRVTDEGAQPDEVTSGQ